MDRGRRKERKRARTSALHVHRWPQICCGRAGGVLDGRRELSPRHVAMSGHCRPKQERTSHALLQGLLLLSVCLAPSQAHPGGARPCPLLDMSPADVTRAPGSSGPRAPENEGLVAHCPVMIPRETPGSADAPYCMSVALLCPHGYPSFCYCLPLAAEHATEDLSAGDAACAPVSTSEMHS